MEIKQPTELTDKQLKAIELLIEGNSKVKISEIVGINRKTLDRWLEKQEFKAEVDRCTQLLKSGVESSLLTNINPIMKRLIDIALSSDSDKTSLDACVYAINRLCGTPTNKTQDISNDKDSNTNVDIEQLLNEVNEDNNVINISQAK